ncbi:MAG: exosortase C-terminal domain/associated protein EpsI [bacterium]|jgi:EpsI family protein
MGANNALGFLRGRHAAILSVVLAAQMAGLYAISKQEVVPLRQPLATFPAAAGAWTMVREEALDEATMDVLRADEVLSRTYYNNEKREAASLFVAYFKSQRTGQTPHSPKNCLPGSGWEPSESGFLPVEIPGRAEPIVVNRYLVSKGESRSVVLYWYQTPRRVVASEYMAKIYMVADAIRYNRTDTAMVRVVVPAGADANAATETAKDFVRSIFNEVSTFLPV